MQAFLLALAASFADIAHFWNEIALSVGGLGALGELLSIGYYELSITFSNAAQLCIEGAVAAANLQTQVDDLQDDLSGALLETALGQAITALWPTFPAFLDDPAEWVLAVLTDAFPELAGFISDPETWFLDLLETWLPIDIQGSGFESIQIEGQTFYANEFTPIGSGFSFTVPEGSWSTAWGSFYGYDSSAGRVAIDVFRENELYASFPSAPPGVDGLVYGISLVSGVDALTPGSSWRVLAKTTGSMSFKASVDLQPGPEPGSWSQAAIQLIGAVGPATWSLDWSGVIPWLEDAFLSVAGTLYALLERIVRYFWEGVY